MRIVGDQWSVRIVLTLSGGAARFTALRAELNQVSTRTLTLRLRILAECGAVIRTAYPEVPPRVEYALTDRGRQLGAALKAAAEWFAEDS
ncbi:winged helix-turn-helix transcriptional regulator [Nocardia brasiliensis]|uniref:winged helix-turn-helix transcriptional regulator n=1 Tax=Nocardia brasiliensis TaxID=37326 RepID=UPI003D8BB791